jgi:bla regulator protein BlaR1
VHELAHIKRRDYLVNLLQSLMEIVFFFNPAVLWVSQLIKAERENCCDDLALAQSSDKVSYVRALLSCEEYQQSVPAYAMAFPGGKGSLFDRVKRIAGNRNHSLNLFEKTVLAICLVVSGLCMSAFAEKENIKRAAHAVVKAIQHIKGDVAQPQQTVVKQTKAVNEPKIQQVNPPVLTAETPMLNADTIIKKIDTNAVKDKTIARVKLQIDSGLRSMTGRLGKLNTDPKPYVTTNINANVKTNIDKIVKANVDKSIKTNVDVNVNTDIKLDAKADVKSKLNLNFDTTVNSILHLDTLRNSSSMSFQSKNDERSTYKANTTLYKPSRVTFSATAPYKPHFSPKLNLTNKLKLKLIVPNMADALYDAGLIKDKTHFTAMITNDVLLVNGVKQSEANHQLILKKYQKKPDDNVNLSFTYPGK